MQNIQKQARELHHDADAAARSLTHLCPSKKLKNLPERGKPIAQQMISAIRVKAEEVTPLLEYDSKEKTKIGGEIVPLEKHLENHYESVCTDSLADLESALKDVYKTRRIQYDAFRSKISSNLSSKRENVSRTIDDFIWMNEKPAEKHQNHSSTNLLTKKQNSHVKANKFLRSVSGKITSGEIFRNT